MKFGGLIIGGKINWRENRGKPSATTYANISLRNITRKIFYNIFLPLQHCLKAFMHCELEVFPALTGNKSTEQETSQSVLALIPRAQQSQQIRKSSPPTKGLNESQERFWLNDKGTNGEVKLEAHASHEAHPAGSHNPLSVAEHGALTSISAFPTKASPPPPTPTHEKIGCQSNTGLPPAVCRWYPFIHLGRAIQS